MLVLPLRFSFQQMYRLIEDAEKKKILMTWRRRKY